jgi:hypothetical protein
MPYTHDPLHAVTFGWRIALAVISLFLAVIAPIAQTLSLETVETAGFDGREWNKPFPNARTADAVHRSLLLRFPGSAEQIAARLAQGGTLTKAELVLDYENFEPHPAGYEVRGQLRETVKKDPPRWHYVAWALRRPWSAAAGIAPTFNAWLGGAGYWTQYGAQDERSDRYPVRLGPTEVSATTPQGRMDVTALLTEATYGATLGQRLRAFEEQGLLLRKLESYDVKYADWSAYEWAVPSGGNGLTFKNARLEVQFADGKTPAVPLPAARDLSALAAKLVGEKTGGRPTAVMPDAATIEALSEKLTFRQPAWMPDWQWARVQELRTIGGGNEYATAIESGDPVQFDRQMKAILAIPPRFWLGWGVQDQLLLWHQYGEALPAYVQDHMKDYWRAWLYPDQPNEAIDIDPQGDRKFAWYKETQDWRGRFSFFRRRWTHGVGTMNFNHTASMGALLGGQMIGSQPAIADGRSGLEKMPLRFWTFQDGTSQEMLDHYYFSITLSAQKMFADYGPTPLDRLMGEIIRDRSVELMISNYHPQLRRMISASGRTLIPNVLGFTQEGGYSVLHTLSPKGVLYHTEKTSQAQQHGMYLYGYDFPPGRVALQTRQSPWAPDWAKHMVDAKPLPYEETSTETTRGNFTNPPLWRRTYLGGHYGLASQDIKGGSVDVLGQWYGGDGAATDADQLGTLTVRYNINAPRLAATGGGYLPYSGGTVTFQHRNKAIVCTKPRTEKERTVALAGAEGVTRLYSTAALWNFRNPTNWQLYVDGTRQTDFPVALKAGQRITLQDGDAYVALLPLPATDLGRDAVVTIEPGIPELLGDRTPTTKIAPALMVNSYNLKGEVPVAADSPLWEKICREAYGGFVIELGDARDAGSFQAFQRKIAAAKLDTRWEAEKRILHVSYRSGKDVMEMGFCTDYAQSEVHYAVEPGQHTKAIPYRRINGQDPYLPAGIARDTTLTQQGTTGRLEKNGATLTLDPGRTGYLQTEPVSGTYVGYNPLPDLTPWALTVPGGVEVRADGKLGLARIALCPGAGTLTIDQAYKAEQLTEPGIARRLLLFGVKSAPVVILNGKALVTAPERVVVEGRTGYAIPLAL